MKTLPNDVTVFNATPHGITFWQDEWAEPITVEPDELINAKPVEELVSNEGGVQYVRTAFVGSDDGLATIAKAKEQYPHAVIVGSIIAAQAYAAEGVVSMVPHPDYARVAPNEKRMLPNKFNIF